jgi:hypothetical protein
MLDVKQIHMTAEQRLSAVYDSLDNMLGRIETGIKVLDTARDLLFSYVYTNTTVRQGDLPQLPKDIDVVLKLIDLVIDDCKLETDIIVGDKNDLSMALDDIQK